MKKFYLFSVLTILSLTISTLNGQITLVLQPGAAEGKDATIWSLEPTTNYGSFTDFIAAQWTWSGDEGTYRSLLEFDLSEIPDNALITCAKLSLFYNDASGTNGQEGENESVIQRITSPWDESTVTWSTMPLTTAVNEVLLPTSAFISEDYPEIDVLPMVTDMVADPDNSHGFLIKLTTEETYSSMKFCSSDFVGNAEKLPKLEICYTVPEAVHNELNSFQVSVSPNPVTDYFTISFNTALHSDLQAALINSNGQSVKSFVIESGITELSVQLTESLPAGIYSLVMCGPEGEIVTRMIRI